MQVLAVTLLTLVPLIVPFVLVRYSPILEDELRARFGRVGRTEDARVGRLVRALDHVPAGTGAGSRDEPPFTSGELGALADFVADEVQRSGRQGIRVTVVSSVVTFVAGVLITLIVT